MNNVKRKYLGGKGLFRHISAKFTEKRLCQSLFFNKVADLRHAHFVNVISVLEKMHVFFDLARN